jgi:hypothetical protein
MKIEMAMLYFKLLTTSMKLYAKAQENYDNYACARTQNTMKNWNGYALL